MRPRKRMSSSLCGMTVLFLSVGGRRELFIVSSGGTFFTQVYLYSRGEKEDFLQEC